MTLMKGDCSLLFPDEYFQIAGVKGVSRQEEALKGDEASKD